MSPISGGYSVGVPPLPIPNRAVKPDGADGTVRKTGEQVAADFERSESEGAEREEESSCSALFCACVAHFTFSYLLFGQEWSAAQTVRGWIIPDRRDARSILSDSRGIRIAVFLF